MAKLLIAHGAPCGVTDSAGWSSFHYAANHRWATWHGAIDGQLAILELLAAHGVNINGGDGEGYTCVHSAAQSGKVSVVKLLRRLGARPDATTVRHPPNPKHPIPNLTTLALISRLKTP